MSKIAFWSYYENFAKNNHIFENDYKWNNKLFYKYQILKKILKNNNFQIYPLNNVNLKEIKALFIYDIPNNITKILSKINKYENIKKFLIIEECKEMRMQNWDLRLHKEFDIIFTWSDQLVSQDKKYKKIFLTNIDKRTNYYQKIRYNNNRIILLNSNKKLSTKNELYSLRKSIIEYAQRNKIENFKLYGNEWNRLTFDMDKWYSFLNSQKFDKIFKTNKYNNIYNGRAEDKDKIVNNFDFSICFENIYGIPDYITEKITDSMTAGCIPVYYGCPNIGTYFPKNTYIDYAEFKSIDKLFYFLTKMPKEKILQYKNDIKKFLNSNESEIFTGDYFANVIADEILSIKS